MVRFIFVHWGKLVALARLWGGTFWANLPRSAKSIRPHSPTHSLLHSLSTSETSSTHTVLFALTFTSLPTNRQDLVARSFFHASDIPRLPDSLLLRVQRHANSISVQIRFTPTLRPQIAGQHRVSGATCDLSTLTCSRVWLVTFPAFFERDLVDCVAGKPGLAASSCTPPSLAY